MRNQVCHCQTARLRCANSAFPIRKPYICRCQSGALRPLKSRTHFEVRAISCANIINNIKKGRGNGAFVTKNTNFAS